MLIIISPLDWDVDIATSVASLQLLLLQLLLLLTEEVLRKTCPGDGGVAALLLPLLLLYSREPAEKVEAVAVLAGGKVVRAEVSRSLKSASLKTKELLPPIDLGMAESSRNSRTPS